MDTLDLFNELEKLIVVVSLNVLYVHGNWLVRAQTTVKYNCQHQIECSWFLNTKGRFLSLVSHTLTHFFLSVSICDTV